MKWDGYCTECRAEIGAFVIDGTRRVLGYACIAEALALTGSYIQYRTTLGRWMKRNRVR